MNLPNKLTLSRIFATPLIILLYLLPIPYGIGVFFALAIYICACLTDLFDGKIARKTNQVTDFGKFADQIADKFLTTTALILVCFSGVTYGWLCILCVLIVVLRDILVSGVRMLAAKYGEVIAADIFGKIKSFVLDVSLMVLMLYIACLCAGWDAEFIRIIGLIGLVGGVLLTIISCCMYMTNAWPLISKVLKESDPSLAKSREDKK
ncbi:MAG: CDP-diacylglycerol--glycerol-3-phosphate 3-phosphatidyltransferase, partial [Clostridia bacterium]|nr:CDP-diacylglycerol--glycerol-3-phosphate 3-phosphatidyltransferase [Clostridia bacterium]